MDERDKIIFLDENNDEIEATLVAIYHRGEDNFIVYLDEAIEKEDERLCAAKYVQEGEEMHLIPITEEADFAFIEEKLKNIE